MAQAELDPEPVEVVLFDLGGVVFTFDWARAIHHWSACSGLGPDVIEARFPRHGDYERFERGELTADEYFAILDHELGTGIGNEQIAHGWNAIFGDLIPGITEAIAAVKASPYRIAALSNTNAAHAATFGARYAVALADIGRVLASHELGARKPEPECFEAACDRLGTAPEHIVFFDDTPTNVDAARSFGMQSVQVTSIADVQRTCAALGITLEALHAPPATTAGVGPESDRDGRSK